MPYIVPDPSSIDLAGLGRPHAAPPGAVRNGAGRVVEVARAVGYDVDPQDVTPQLEDAVLSLLVALEQLRHRGRAVPSAPTSAAAHRDLVEAAIAAQTAIDICGDGRLVLAHQRHALSLLTAAIARAGGE